MLSQHQSAARAACAVEFRPGCDIQQAWERVQARVPRCDPDVLSGMAALYAATIPVRRPVFAKSASTERRIMAYLSACEPGVTDQGRQDRIFTVAVALVRGFSLSPESALPYLMVYNDRCEPPMTERQLQHKLSDATKARAEQGYLLREPT